MNKPEKVPSVADIKDLMKESHRQEGEDLCHWYVEFSVRIPHLTAEEREAFGIETEPGAPIELDNLWATDEITIQGGSNAMDIISWLTDYVNNPEEYGLTISGFRLTGINLLSEADLSI